MYIPMVGPLQGTSGGYLIPYLKWVSNLAIIHLIIATLLGYNLKMVDFKLGLKNSRYVVKF